MRLLYFINRRGDSRIARIHEIHRISCHCEEPKVTRQSPGRMYVKVSLSMNGTLYQEIATSGKALLAMTVVVGGLMRSRRGLPRQFENWLAMTGFVGASIARPPTRNSKISCF